MAEAEQQPKFHPLPRLREWRGQRMLSLRELAKASGVTVRAIIYLEKGRTGARPATVRKLAGALQVDTTDLLRPADATPPSDGDESQPPSQD